MSSGKSNLDAFFAILDAYKKTLGWALGSSAILPLIASLTGLAPLWPDGVSLLASLTTLLMIILSFQFLSRSRKKRINLTMALSLTGAAVLLAAYLIITSIFTFSIPTNDKKIYLGCGWSKLSIEVAADYDIDASNGCPGRYVDILKDAEYENTRVWTASSVSTIRLVVLALWISFFSLLSMFISSFLVYQSERKN